MKTLHTLLLSLGLSILCAQASAEGPRVLMKTSMGEITLELDADKAPLSASNFLGYVDDGFYNGTIFHRVIRGFMIQGGGLEPNMHKKTPGQPIENEAKNGLKNLRGTIAMARTGYPHSATAQFFINHQDNTNLDYPAHDGWGYAVFGRVVSGMEVVDAIADLPTGVLNGRRDVPKDTVLIEFMNRIE